jgi:SAM-dependent methyltransferase
MARLIASSHPEWDVVGLDVNPNYIAYARDRAKAASLDNLSFEHGDLQALSFAAASFDVVWSRFVLYFLPQPEIAIAEFKRILRPGGEIVIALHNWSTLIDYPEDLDLRRRRMRVFSSIADMHLAQKMPSMLSAGGFHDVSVEIELDRVYSAIGSIGPEARRNYVEVLEAGIERAVESVGNRSEAERFVSDLLVYLDRPDTYTYSLLWTIKCQTRGPPADPRV